jgi:hypothetical protein
MGASAVADQEPIPTEAAKTRSSGASEKEGEERGERDERERMMGFEPTTFCMASRRSSQLSYIREATQYSRGLAHPHPARGAANDVAAIVRATASPASIPAIRLPWTPAFEIAPSPPVVARFVKRDSCFAVAASASP